MSLRLWPLAARAAKRSAGAGAPASGADVGAALGGAAGAVGLGGGPDGRWGRGRWQTWQYMPPPGRGVLQCGQGAGRGGRAKAQGRRLLLLLLLLLLLRAGARPGSGAKKVFDIACSG